MSAITAEQQAASQASRPSVFQNRTFLSLFTGHIISVVGDGFHSVALGLWVLQTTGSASAMAAVMAVKVIVGILLGAVAGTVVDRVDRRRLMITMNIFRFVLVGGLALLLTMESTPFWAVLVLTGLTAVCAQFFSPAFQASLVNIVGKEDLPRASGLLQVGSTLAQVAGPFLGGTIVGFFGGWAALVGDAVTFLVAALLIFAAGSFASPRRDSEKKSSFFADMKEGFSYMRNQPLVRSVVTLAPVVNFFGNAMGVLLPVIAIRIWMASEIQFGLMEGAFPLGFAVGAGLVLALSKKLQRRGRLMLLGILFTGVFSTGIVLMPSLTAALPLILLTGAVNAVVNVLFQITLQAEVPTEVQGRVFGTLMSLVQVASPAALLLAGLLGDLFSPVAISAAAGIITTVFALASFVLYPALRTYN